MATKKLSDNKQIICIKLIFSGNRTKMILDINFFLKRLVITKREYINKGGNFLPTQCPLVEEKDREGKRDTELYYLERERYIEKKGVAITKTYCRTKIIPNVFLNMILSDIL